jgi:hypothetical protein
MNMQWFAEIMTVEKAAFQLSAENNPDGPEIQVISIL